MEEIKAILIFEMLGRPPEHLKDTLFKFIDRISKESGVNIFDKKINEPKRIEEAKQELYSTFAEVEADFDNINTLLNIIFIYMPSHIEIISPSEVSLKNSQINDLSNEITRKLHQYDELAKRLMIEKQILENQLHGQKPMEIKEKKKTNRSKKGKKAGKK